jgi:hypothetical protein
MYCSLPGTEIKEFIEGQIYVLCDICLLVVVRSWSEKLNSFDDLQGFGAKRKEYEKRLLRALRNTRHLLAELRAEESDKENPYPEYQRRLQLLDELEKQELERGDAVCV